MEAEYMSLSDASKKRLLEFTYSDLDISTASPPLFYSDSTSALSPMSLHHIKDPSRSIFDIIKFVIPSKNVRFRWNTFPQKKIQGMYSQSAQCRFTSSLCPQYGSQIDLWLVKDMSNV